MSDHSSDSSHHEGSSFGAVMGTLFLFLFGCAVFLCCLSLGIWYLLKPYSFPTAASVTAAKQPEPSLTVIELDNVRSYGPALPESYSPPTAAPEANAEASVQPSSAPTASIQPTTQPSSMSATKSVQPTVRPSSTPTAGITTTAQPSSTPVASITPTTQPSSAPTASVRPSTEPTPGSVENVIEATASLEQ